MHLADIQEKLKAVGKMTDDAVPLAETVLMLGALEREGVDLAPYHAHLDAMKKTLSDMGEKKSPEDRLHALNEVMRQYAYRGDTDESGDPETINMLSVIDSKCGIPVALGILYMILAEDRGWEIAGLNFPGHFLFHLKDGAKRLIVDPFDDGRNMQAGDLRRILKKSLGERAELHHHYYETVTRREVILRLGNNRRMRQIVKEDYGHAFQTIIHQLWIAPDEPRLYYEAGVICIKLDRLNDAREYLQEFLVRSDDPRSIAEAQNMLAGLRRVLH
jgi:regulator of sirC expression with transglutaminase-like and TPR domain